MNEIDVRVVDSILEFERLREQWEALQTRAVTTSIFETFDWQYLWWQTYGRDSELRLLLATETGNLVGILALHVQKQRVSGFPVRLLRFVGNGGDTSPDDLGPVLASGRDEHVVARALAEAVLRIQGWDVLQFPDMIPSCPFTAAIASVTRGAGLETRTGRAERIAYVELPPTWDGFMESLSGHRRKRIRYIRKRLCTSHPSRFFVWNDPSTLDEAFDRLAELHRKRWNQIGHSQAFGSPEYLGFHRAVMKACMAQDRLRLYCLELSGQVAAMQYCYKFRDAVYIMQTGFDPDFSDAGQVLLTYMVEHAIGEGHRVLDFLRGEHAYKEHFATGERETMFVSAFRRTPGAWAFLARRHYLPVIKAHLVRAINRLRSAKSKAEE